MRTSRTFIVMRRVIGVCVLSTLAGCGGGTTSVAPTPPSNSPTPAPNPNRWSVQGRVVETVTGVPLAGAALVFSDALGSVTTDSTGSFRFETTALPQFTTYRIAVSAAGHLNRTAAVRWERGDRPDAISIDLLADRAPFSLTFYRYLVRNGLEGPGDLQPLRRWIDVPKVYVRTQDANGRAVEPEVLAVVQEWLRRGLSLWTNGQWSVAILETGTADRADTPGWIVVDFVRNSENYCGFSFVGRNPGRITLNNDRCNCGSVKVPPSTVVHELGHALGFFHVPAGSGVMAAQNPGGCFPTEPSAAEQYHADIAYRRPVGNTDIDIDSLGGTAVLQPVRIAN